MEYDVLLISPKSIKHGPPDELQNAETINSICYSGVLNNRCINYLNKASDFNGGIEASSFKKKYMVNYGLLMLSAILDDNGISNKYLVADYYDDEVFVTKIYNYSKTAKIVCFTSTTPQYNNVLSLKEIVEKSNSKAVILFGGPHAFAYKLLTQDGFDYIHVGYDINVTYRLIKRILLEPIKQDECRVVFSQGFTDYRKNFQVLPKEYAKETLLYTFFDFGCPNHCSYCIEHKLTNCIYKSNIDAKIEEIRVLIEEYGIRFVHIADSDFLLFQNRAKTIISELRRHHFNCCFSINVSVKSLSLKNSVALIEEFSEIGLVEILVGVEHFSEKVMIKMNKPIEVRKFFSTLNKIRNLDNTPIISFYTLVGLPFEYKENISENIQALKKCEEYGLCDFTFPKFLVPYPGTDVFEHPQEYDVIIKNYNWEEYHRWGLPRPIIINHMSDKYYIDEIKFIHDIFLKNIENKNYK